LGNTCKIYDQPLKDSDLNIDPDGGITLIIDAAGINCSKSRYRYQIRLTIREAHEFAEAALARQGGN